VAGTEGLRQGFAVRQAGQTRNALGMEGMKRTLRKGGDTRSLGCTCGRMMGKPCSELYLHGRCEMRSLTLNSSFFPSFSFVIDFAFMYVCEYVFINFFLERRISPRFPVWF
jgi:hypothetical protein